MVQDKFVARLKPHIEVISVCPEVEIVLGIPRAPVRIICSGDDFTVLPRAPFALCLYGRSFKSSPATRIYFLPAASTVAPSEESVQSDRKATNAFPGCVNDIVGKRSSRTRNPDARYVRDHRRTGPGQTQIHNAVDALIEVASPP